MMFVSRGHKEGPICSNILKRDLDEEEADHSPMCIYILFSLETNEFIVGVKIYVQGLTHWYCNQCF